MEELLSTKNMAILMAVFAATSEIIGILKIDSNSNIQLGMTIFKRLFGAR